MLTFDENELVTELIRLPTMLRVVFAAACAERQMPAYRLFHAQTGQGDPKALQLALDDIWEHPSAAESSTYGEERLEELMALIPQEEGFVGVWTQNATNAQNAAMSVIYALRTRITGEAQEAAWSARVAYEALDNFVINTEHIDSSKPGGEQLVLSHRLIQAELGRQRRDLSKLLQASLPRHDLIAQLRHIARDEAMVFL